MKKTLHGILGGLLIVGGGVLLVLPGPGLLLILLGLALLASHSERARALLGRLREKLSRHARDRRLKGRLGEDGQ